MFYTVYTLLQSGGSRVVGRRRFEKEGLSLVRSRNLTLSSAAQETCDSNLKFE